MNYGRLALAAVVATVVDSVYGFLSGTLLASEFDRYPYVFRPPEVGPSYLPLMFVGILLAMFAAAYIYAKGYEGGAGVAGRDAVRRVPGRVRGRRRATSSTTPC